MKRQILIVEDDPTFRGAIKRALSGRDFIFYEAQSVHEGIKLLDAEKSIQVILLDLRLPGLDGTNLLEHIKERASKYRIIVITGHDEYLAAEQAKGYEVFAYLAKADDSSDQYLIFEVEKAFWDIEKAHLMEKLDKHLEIEKQITSDEPLNKILDLTCRHAVTLMGGYTCHIRLLDIQKGDFSLVACQGPYPGVRNIFRGRITTSDVFSGRVAKSGRAEFIDDLQNHEDFVEMKRLKLSASHVEREVREYYDTVQSAYIVPISTKIFESEVDAVFNISSTTKAFFNEEKRRLVDEFVTQAEIAIIKNWLDIRRKDIHNDYSNSSALLVNISEHLQKENNLDNIYDIVIDGISRIVNPEVISIFRYNERNEQLENVAEYSGDSRVENPEEVFPGGESLTGSVYSEGETIRIPSPLHNYKPTEDPRYDPRREKMHLEKIPSGRIDHYLGVPLKVGEDTIGVIRAVNKKSDYYEDCVKRGIRISPDCLLERGFSRDCETVLEIIASHLAVAIRNAELVNKLSWKINQLQTLTQVVRRIGSEGDTTKLLSLVVSKTAEVLRAEICMLFLKEEQKDEITLMECYGMPLPRTEKVSYKLGDGKTGEVALTGKSLLERTAEKTHPGRYNHLVTPHLRPDENGKKEIKSFMAVPIITLERSAENKDLGKNNGSGARPAPEREENARGVETAATSPESGQSEAYSERENIIGVLKVFNKTEDDLLFDNDDLNIFETFASQIAVALAIDERNTTLSELVHGVCHEIRNKLGMIDPNLVLIGEELDASEESPIKAKITDKLARINTVTHQARDFVDDLLAFSISHFQNRKKLDINELIDEAISQILVSSRNIKNINNIDVVRDYFEGGVLCDIYRTPFIHIIQNIVINGLEAMVNNDRGTLTVRTSKDPSGQIALITISDNGTGISEEDLPKIYKAAFYKKPGGNGLGLWLVKKYLPQMDGVISEQSRLGHGTTFTIQLPVADAQLTGG